MSFLLDTNIISELVRRRPNPRVVEWAERVGYPALSVITVDELFFGLAARANPAVHQWLEDYLAAECQVLEITDPIARHAGLLRGQLARRGRIRTQADMLIAATASAHGLTLATHNTRDFDGCGIAVFDPFA